jgi:hypothetical protein
MPIVCNSFPPFNKISKSLPIIFFNIFSKGFVSIRTVAVGGSLKFLIIFVAKSLNSPDVLVGNGGTITTCCLLVNNTVSCHILFAFCAILNRLRFCIVVSFLKICECDFN